MISRKLLNFVLSAMMIASLLLGAGSTVAAKTPLKPETAPKGQDGTPPMPQGRITPEQRRDAAARNSALGLLPGAAAGVSDTKDSKGGLRGGPLAGDPDPAVVPHYFGPYANYANSPLPKGAIGSITVDNPGSGYTAPVVNILDVYGTGVGATASAVLDVNGSIVDIIVTDPGADYSAPIVVIEDATGIDAAATPNLGGTLTGGIHKFVDSMPGLTAANSNNLGQYLPVAIPDTTTYPGDDYYEIELGEYTEQLHSDLPPTTLRGYRQVNTSDPTVNKFHYLGPIIVASRDRAVRIKFINSLGTGAAGDLFIPVDASVMGAGEGPLDALGLPCDPDVTECATYTENRATLHLHGGLNPWISDGTPHQWVTPAGEVTPYKKGVSTTNVPDMWFEAGVPIPNTVGQTTQPAGHPTASTDPGDGSMTFYYTNQQSARLMFYHDHAYGITRLNVYAGEAAGYVITDPVEQDLMNGTNVTGVNPTNAQVLPGIGIPLIIQDKTFVDETTIGAQDPTWKWGTGAIDPGTGRRVPKTGDLWLPSVYMPAQNPYDVSGASAFGRWQYGPWFWPPTENIINLPIANEYYDPGCDPTVTWCEPPVRPAMPTPSMGMEAFMDLAMVNGTVYPYLNVEPKTYRFRVLNAANDRFFNLQLYVADPTVVTDDGRHNTEVKMVDALANPDYPTWPADGRAGGVPDPTTVGPDWIQIGTESGFLPAPVVIPPQPLAWNGNATAFNFGNVTDHSLLLGNAERADVLVDFSAYAGQTLILYNDAPAAFPALDPRYDYYTGNPSQMDTGGAPTTQPGYGPNTRTIMQFRVANTAPAAPYDMATLEAVFAKTGTKNGVFEQSQHEIIVPQSAYNSAYDANLPSTAVESFVRITDRSKTFTPLGATTPVSITFEEKAIHDEMGASYDAEWGRMSGNLGLELPGTNNLNQNIILYGYASPPVDVLQDSLAPIGQLGDGTQIWKITHNGVDTHPIHFHLVDVQLINRVAWDGAILPPEPNELGWKETLRVNPLESTIVAMRPRSPVLPFDLPNSIRPIDVTKPLGAILMGPPGGFLDPALNAISVPNHVVNYGWEYVWHCHILSHEEMDMMHALSLGVIPLAPSNLTVSGSAGTVDLTWKDNSANETAFTIERTADGVTVPIVVPSVTGPAKGGTISYSDIGLVPGKAYTYTVKATNVVGDTYVYAGSVGFPTQTKHSAVIGPLSNITAVQSITRASANPTSASSVNFTVTFTGPVTGVTTADFALTSVGLTGASVSSVSGSGATYTVAVNTGTGSGTLRLDLADGNNSIGGLSAGNTTFTGGETYNVDKTPASVTSILRTAGFANPSRLTGVNFTVTFNEPVTGVDVADFTLVTAGVTGASVKSVTGSGSTYTVTVLTGTANTGTVRLDLVDNDTILDLGGLPLGGTGLGNGTFTTGQGYIVDNVVPTVSYSMRSSANPTSAASVVFTVKFSEVVTGVDLSDFTLTTTGVTGASIASLSGTGHTYTVTVNTGSGSGTIRLNVRDNDSIVDATGNALGGLGQQNYITGQVYTVDKSLPVVSYINLASTNPTGAATVNFTVVFSKAVTGVDTTDFALTTTGVTGASVASVSGSGTTYTVTVNTGTGSGTIRLDLADNDTIVDTASNPLGGAGVQNFTSGQTYTIDKAAPTVRWIIRSGATPTGAATVNFSVEFNKSVTGVDTADFALTTSGITGASVASVSGSGTTYTVTVNTGTGNGTIRLDLADNDTIVDTLGNPVGGPGTQNFTSGQSYVIEKTAPTVRWITRSGATPTGAATVNFSVVFSETVTGVDTTDFSLTTSGLTGASVASVSGSGTTYTVTVNTGTGNGTVRLDITDNNSIIDTASNPLGGAGTQNFTGGQSYSIDKTVPTVRWITRSGTSPTGAATVTYSVVFSETVTGVDVSDFTLTTSGITGASVASVTGSGTTYTVTVNTGTGNGTIRLDLADNDSIVDTASNPLSGVGVQNFTGGQSYIISR